MVPPKDRPENYCAYCCSLCKRPLEIYEEAPDGFYFTPCNCKDGQVSEEEIHQQVEDYRNRQQQAEDYWNTWLSTAKDVLKELLPQKDGWIITTQQSCRSISVTNYVCRSLHVEVRIGQGLKPYSLLGRYVGDGLMNYSTLQDSISAGLQRDQTTEATGVERLTRQLEGCILGIERIRCGRKNLKSSEVSLDEAIQLRMEQGKDA